MIDQRDFCQSTKSSFENCARSKRTRLVKSRIPHSRISFASYSIPSPSGGSRVYSRVLYHSRIYINGSNTSSEWKIRNPSVRYSIPSLPNRHSSPVATWLAGGRSESATLPDPSRGGRERVEKAWRGRDRGTLPPLDSPSEGREAWTKKQKGAKAKRVEPLTGGRKRDKRALVALEEEPRGAREAICQACFGLPDTVGKHLNADRPSPLRLASSRSPWARSSPHACLPRGFSLDPARSLPGLPPPGIIIDRVRSNWKTLMVSDVYLLLPIPPIPPPVRSTSFCRCLVYHTGTLPALAVFTDLGMELFCSRVAKFRGWEFFGEIVET